jgi:hypothetical protein
MIKVAAFDGAGCLPPAVETVALVGANDEGAVAGFAAGLGALELRTNFIARSGGGPGVGGGGVRGECGAEKTTERSEDGFHVNIVMVARAEM